MSQIYTSVHKDIQIQLILVQFRFSFQARITNSGVEARLLKAIQENQLQQFNVDDTCSQCQATSASRQSTMQLRGNRLGYEVIYWKDGDFFVQRVPSNDAISRMSINRDGSIYGGSVSGSHHYEYIGGHQTDCSYSSAGRNSNHSNRLYGRNSVQNINDVSDPSLIGTEIDQESVRCGSAIDHYRSGKTSDHLTNYKVPWKSSRTSVTSIHSRYQDRDQDLKYFADRNPYQPSGSDKFPYCENQCDMNLRQGYYSDTYRNSEHSVTRNKRLECDNDYFSKEMNGSLLQGSKEDNPEANDHAIRGYRYVFNPSCYEDPTPKCNDDTIDLQQLQSAIFELTGKASQQSEQTLNESLHKAKVKQRRPSTCSNVSDTVDSASISGHSSSFTKSTLSESCLPPHTLSNSNTNNLI